MDRWIQYPPDGSITEGVGMESVDRIVTSPPRGVTISTRADGYLVVGYREPRFWVRGVSFAALLAAIIVAFVGSSRSDIDDELWMVFIGVGLFMTFFRGVRRWLWDVFLTTEFAFAPEQLTVIQRNLRVRRTRHFARAAIREVAQFQEYVVDEADRWGLKIFPCWGKPVRVMSGSHSREASEWLGPIIAQWAGVPFVLASDRQ